MKKAGIYIHIPFCKVKCIYCDFYSITEEENSIERFTNAIIQEIKIVSPLIKSIVTFPKLSVNVLMLVLFPLNLIKVFGYGTLNSLVKLTEVNVFFYLIEEINIKMQVL